jgi:hypothetical protein
MPWLRAGFKHPLIAEWAQENRSALVHAALTLDSSLDCCRKTLAHDTPGIV